MRITLALSHKPPEQIEGLDWISLCFGIEGGPHPDRISNVPTTGRVKFASGVDITAIRDALGQRTS